MQLNFGNHGSGQINTMGNDHGSRFFDLNLPSMEELIQAKKRAHTDGKSLLTLKKDEQTGR